MNGAAFLGIEVDAARIQRRIDTGYLDTITNKLDEAWSLVTAACGERRPLSVGLVGNCAEVLPEMVRRGWIPDVLTDGECGRLVAPEDMDALAAALVDLGRDAALRRKLGEAAEVRAESFSTSVAREKLLAVYAALARAKGLQ